VTADESPAAAYAWALGHARGVSTWRLRRLEARARRRADGLVTARQLATWAAIRDALRERGVDLPADTDPGRPWRERLVSAARLALGVIVVVALAAMVVAVVISAGAGAGLDTRGRP
jgi:hypothetical protein